MATHSQSGKTNALPSMRYKRVHPSTTSVWEMTAPAIVSLIPSASVNLVCISRAIPAVFDPREKRGQSDQYVQRVAERLPHFCISANCSFLKHYFLTTEKPLWVLPRNCMKQTLVSASSFVVAHPGRQIRTP